ncbi:polysaccharide deacetylase family protein [Taibaiella koreensis]|uniref:hypothetical protein n=1 Tax=Taibaiella koreensis TaxID=1268548 RepID=UPI0019690971|nr:hypothetical protein [Taibaiella koreensis]
MKRLFLTLDYELFFGTRTGSVARCLIEPTEALLRITDAHDLKIVFFVDAGYLVALKRQMGDCPALQQDYETVTAHLRALSAGGHDIQLHIHPHWEDSFYDTARQQWDIDISRYKLADFDEVQIDDIVRRYKAELEHISGKEVFAYRAGGWCIQPFHKLSKAFRKHGIWLDSTVFYNGNADSEAHAFDFKGAPEKTVWQFDQDPVVAQQGGFFTEVPIAAYKVTPLFFARFALAKKKGGAQHKAFGDGRSIAQSRSWIIKKFLGASYSVVSIDGYKSSYLARAYRQWRTGKDNLNFVIIGHPKAFTPYSLTKFKQFLEAYRATFSPATFQENKHEITQSM